MKWLFFILLLANSGLFVWIYPQLNGPRTKPEQPIGGESILLLSEVDASAKDTLGETDVSVEQPAGKTEDPSATLASDAEQTMLPPDDQGQAQQAPVDSSVEMPTFPQSRR